MRKVENFSSGYDVWVFPETHIGRRVISDGEWESEVSERIRELCPVGGTVVDVGANIGLHTLTMADSVGEDGRVLAFEPNPTTFSLLEENVSENGFDNVELFNCGISDESTDRILNVRRDNFGASSVFSHSDDFEWDEISVSMYPLSKFVSEIDFLKIDAEGSEIRIVPFLNLDEVESAIIEIHKIFLSDSEVDSILTYLKSDGDIEWLNRQVVWTRH